MRFQRFFTLSSIVLISLDIALASPPTIPRRTFIRSLSACLLAGMLPLDAASPAVPVHQWSIRPDSDLEVLGLENFGRSVKELLEAEGYVADPVISERIRWGLQEALWRRLEPKSAGFSPTRVRTTVAIWISKNQYLYLDPEFSLEPGPGTAGRTVGKISYLYPSGDPRRLSYWVGAPPTDPSVVTVGKDARNGH